MQKGGDPIRDEQVSRSWSPGERCRQGRASIGILGKVGAGNAELEETMKSMNRLMGAAMAALMLAGATRAFAQDWPQWRGPDRSGKVTGFTAPQTWPKELTLKWKATVGPGDSTPALVGDKLYTFRARAMTRSLRASPPPPARSCGRTSTPRKR